MTKVCHMTSRHSSNDVRIFYKECSSLARAGYDVYFVAPGTSREENGVHIVGVGEVPSRRVIRMTTFAHKVYEKALAIDADIYHFHDPELLPYGMKLKRHGKKVIFDSHENYSLQITIREYIPKAARNAIANAYHAYESLVLKRLDAVIVPCTFEGKNIFEGRAKETCIITNYPIASELSGGCFPGRQREGYLCYVGSLTHSRGISYLIRAAAKAGVKLVLAGAFSSAEFEHEMRAMPEFSSVDYRGVASRQEVAEIFQGALAGACTLLRNGQYDKGDTLGTKVFEYMAVGLPVILSDSPYAKTSIKHCKFGICVDPADVDAIADAIIYLRDHPEEAREMGENGRRAVAEEFNWGTQAGTLLELYKNILQEV